MPRRAREVVGGVVYHILNRGNLRARIFAKEGDYAAFESVLVEAVKRVELELFAWVAMPNHWHMVVRPKRGRDLSEFARWLTVTHTQRWRAHTRTEGEGHLYQGRYKSFPVEADVPFLRLCRYVERNPLRSGLVERAEDWRWGSLGWRQNEWKGVAVLSAWPVEMPANWLALVNRPATAAEEEAIRLSITRGRPYGTEEWSRRVVEKLGLEHTLRGRGRPKKIAAAK